MKKRTFIEIILDCKTLIEFLFLIGFIAIIIANKLGYLLFFKGRYHAYSALILIGIFLFEATLSRFYKKNRHTMFSNEQLLQLLDLRGHENILLLGCQDGTLLVELAKILSTGRIFGLELQSSQTLEHIHHAAIAAQCKEKIIFKKGPKLNFFNRKKTIATIPLPNQIVDCMIANFTITATPAEHDNFNVRGNACIESARVLKPHGLLVILTTDNPKSICNELLKLDFQEVTSERHTAIYCITAYSPAQYPEGYFRFLRKIKTPKKYFILGGKKIFIK